MAGLALAFIAMSCAGRELSPPSSEAGFEVVAVRAVSCPKDVEGACYSVEIRNQSDTVESADCELRPRKGSDASSLDGMDSLQVHAVAPHAEASFRVVVSENKRGKFVVPTIDCSPGPRF